MNNSGILLVNKSESKTSFSIVSILRKITQIRKIGHSGTLDPFATGLMVMLIGKEYTKKSDSFINSKKEYRAKIHLGYITDSFDPETPLEEVSTREPSLKEVEEVIASFQGKTKQIPPMYSAKKIKGQKLYNLARKGITIERSPHEIELFITLQRYTYPYIEIDVRCSKGTYIRTLANDIGDKLKVGAYLKKLLRTKLGDFDLKDAIDQSSLYDSDIDISKHLIS